MLVFRLIVLLNIVQVRQNMVPQYEFVNPFDPLGDGSPYEAVPTDKLDFIEYANKLKTTKVLFLFPILFYLNLFFFFQIITDC